MDALRQAPDGGCKNGVHDHAEAAKNEVHLSRDLLMETLNEIAHQELAAVTSRGCSSIAKEAP
jgi:hypothetical protein